MSLKGPRRGAASGTARSLVVLLHGYGADGNDLIGLADPLAAVLPDTVFVAPDAPERSRINPMGRQWFPIPWIDGSTDAERDAGFARAAATLDAWLGETLAAEGLDEGRVALVGFSQGTMMGLHAALHRPAPLAGVVGFSGRYVAAGDAPTATPPVLLVHGDRDEVIPVDALEEARAALAALGVAVRWHVSRGVGHGIAPDGLQLAARFLRERLQASG